MDGKFIAGLFIGLIVGAAIQRAATAWRSYRGAKAGLPGLRQNAMLRGRHAVFLGGLCLVAALVAFKNGG